MKVLHFDEPELEFGVGQHIDVRFGIMDCRTLDFDSTRVIRVGIVGLAPEIEALTSWIERCRQGVPAKVTRHPNLFPRFPGFDQDSPFGTRIEIDPRFVVGLSLRDLERLPADDRATAVKVTVDIYNEGCRSLLDKGRPDVILCALPEVILALTDPSEQPSPVALRAVSGQVGQRPADLHDLLKATLLPLGIPAQLVRPETVGTPVRKRKSRPQRQRTLQDEATRAWNFHTALYYKAGGTPWRLIRDPQALTACYVGVSFYESADKASLLTSMAEVFNERGQGMIVRGAPAQLDKRDRSPHLGSQDAYELMLRALDAYLLEHRTLPARLVIHKTSRHSQEELDGFLRAAEERQVDSVDALSLGGSDVRLFRYGAYPPLRGTYLELDENHEILYTRGSVDFFGTYPGMYVPRPLQIRIDRSAQTGAFLAREILALTKMNWNNTQFDGSQPITVRAARQVGWILRYVPSSSPLQSAYAFYM